MLDIFKDFINTNQFATGGIILMLLGTILRFIYSNIPVLLRFMYSRLFLKISFDSENDFYYDFNSFFEQHNNSKTLMLSTNKNISNHFISDSEFNSKYLSLSAGLGWHFLLIESIPVFIFKYEIKDKMRVIYNNDCYFLSTNKEKVVNLISRLKGYSDKYNSISIFNYSRGGGWHKSNHSKRTLASVVIPRNIKGLLLKSFDSFLYNEEFYKSIGVPHRLGILLYGLPGTGKTSLVKALASHYNLNIYVMNLESIDNFSINEIIKRLTPNSILLLEDIDKYDFNKDSDSNISLRTLINVIDGIDTPEGIIIVMTANNPDLLDKALVRSGRIDLKIAFTYADLDQKNELTKKVLQQDNSELLELISTYNLTTSDIQVISLLYKKEGLESVKSFLTIYRHIFN